jgi:hypothetical protein
MAVTASLACTITSFIQMAFAIGMMFFPTKMMEGYQADTFSGGKDTSFFCFAMGIFGLQQMYGVMCNVSSSKAYVPDKERSVQCFCNALTWGAFVLLDGRLLLGTPYSIVGEGKPIPAAAIGFNLFLFAGIAYANFLGWKESGSATPDVGAFLGAFKGGSRMPLFVGCFNQVWFGLGCGFFTEQFLEMYTPGTIAALPGTATVSPMVFLILGNAGKIMLLNLFTTVAIASAGDQAASYRMLRCMVLTQMVYLGMFSRDQIIFASMDWANPGVAMSFVQTFGTSFYLASKLGAIAGGDMTFKKKE